jgi:cytochrome c5
MKLFFAVLLSFYTCSLFAIVDTEQQKIQQRIQPEGQVHVQEPSDTTSKMNVESKVKTELKQGQTIFEQHCTVCHRDGLVGAPKLHNEKDWKPRLAGRTIKDLVASSIKGLNAMPARGTCTECSDSDLEAAIHYMLPKS